MKRLILVPALLLGAATAAEASCTKSSLNGSWSIYIVSGSSGPGVTISNGSFSVGGTPYTISSFGSNCRGIGTNGTGASILPFVVTSEDIKSTSSAVPNMLTLTILSGPTVATQYLFRK